MIQINTSYIYNCYVIAIKLVDKTSINNWTLNIESVTTVLEKKLVQ